VTRAAVKKERPAPATRTVARRDMTGKELGQVELPGDVFGIVPNEAVLHQVVTAQLAAARAGTHSTKTRAEVRGGGAKPYRQKGTGRARQGSSRSPLWSGGGIALGPKPRSYRQRTPKKMVRLALCSALSDRAAEERVALVDAWRFEVPRTKDAVAALDALGLEGRVLVVLEPDELAAERSFSNLERVETALSGELSAYDVLRSDWVVFTDGTLPGAEGAAGPAEATGDGRTEKVAPAGGSGQAGEPAADTDAADATAEAGEPAADTDAADATAEAGVSGATDPTEETAP
jgi:large subunit ribosomal protein L4